MSNTLLELTPKQLRQAASLKEKLASLQLQLKRLVGAEETRAASSSPKRKRRMSAAARKKISLAMKKKWAGRKSAAK